LRVHSRVQGISVCVENVHALMFTCVLFSCHLLEELPTREAAESLLSFVVASNQLLLELF
jgi:hypothetical protein